MSHDQISQIGNWLKNEGPLWDEGPIVFAAIFECIEHRVDPKLAGDIRKVLSTSVSRIPWAGDRINEYKFLVEKDSGVVGKTTRALAIERLVCDYFRGTTGPYSGKPAGITIHNLTSMFLSIHDELPSNRRTRKLTILASLVCDRCAALVDSFPGKYADQAFDKLAKYMNKKQLVELLKRSTCVRERRKSVLRELGERCGRQFEHVWEFVAWAQKNEPELDLISPVEPPETIGSAD